jgi:predicted Kef-type K+ transport protein
MDPMWIVVAFIFGFVARLVGLPPLVGFLAAGFALNAFGAEGGEIIERVADIGVYLLLFSIGLKLDLRSLLRPQIWGVTTLHMAITTLVIGLGVFALGVAGLAAFGGLDFKLSLLIAFALSYSSTVFAVKVFEDKGEMLTLHGRTAIGILIMQDVVAIVFLMLSTGKVPSPWALLLLALPVLRPIVLRIMTRSGHGELMVLLGLIFALGSAGLFDIVGLKPDLGPLVAGVLIAGHPKSNELAKTLLGFKDLFLTGFFLSIGLSGAPGFRELGVAVLLVLLVPLKAGLFFYLLTRFNLRARTSLLTSLSLANYSEFGLIVGAVGVSSGWIGSEWLVVIAIALSISFVFASPLNVRASDLYAWRATKLRRFETDTRLPEEQAIDTGDATILVAGMGRIGAGAYDCMHRLHGDTVIGVDSDSKVVTEHERQGRRVIVGDVTDCDFWDRTRMERVGVVLLTMPSQGANLAAIRQLSAADFRGFVAATAQFTDEVEELKKAGANAAFNFYAEAGSGFAQHVSDQLNEGASP